MTKKPNLKDCAIQRVKDAKEVLVSLEHLAIRVFIFAMAIYGSPSVSYLARYSATKRGQPP